MSTATPDISQMTAAQIREFIESQPVTPEGVTPEGEASPEPELPPRDEQGRFTKVEENEPPVNETEEVQTEEAEAGPVEEYTATIDIGDGAGVQVFSAPTKDELLAKLIEAQENATRKIRELSTKKTEAPKEPTTPTPDEELALAQEFLANPSQAFDRLYQKRREEERQREAEAQRQAAEAAKAVDAAAKQFIVVTPDYYEHPKNAARIEGWLKLNGNLDPTFENIQAAYTDLNNDGLLLPKPDPAVTKTARSSGISVRRSAAPSSPPAGKDPRTMSLEELREVAGGYIYKG
jgi:hypothetical protein